MNTIVVANRIRNMQENLKIINNCSSYYKYCDNFIVLDNFATNVSATMIRNLFNTKDYTNVKKYIYPSVYKYILDNKLYF